MHTMIYIFISLVSLFILFYVLKFPKINNTLFVLLFLLLTIFVTILNNKFETFVDAELATINNVSFSSLVTLPDKVTDILTPAIENIRKTFSGDKETPQEKKENEWTPQIEYYEQNPDPIVLNDEGKPDQEKFDKLIDDYDNANFPINVVKIFAGDWYQQILKTFMSTPQ